MVAPRAVCLFLPLFVPRSSSGATRPSSHVILAPSVLSPCSNSTFGGQLLLLTPGITSRPVHIWSVEGVFPGTGRDGRLCITRSPTVRWREPIRIWRQCCNAYVLGTLLLGVLTSPGLNTLSSYRYDTVGYLPPLFPSQEQEIAITSVQLNVHRIRMIWRETSAALLRTQDQNQWLADQRHTPAPEYMIASWYSFPSPICSVCLHVGAVCSPQSAAR